MITYGTMSDTRAQNMTEMLVDSPTIRPARMLPQKLPIPPSTTMIKAGMRMAVPIVGRTLQIGAAITPATPARMAPIAKTKVRIRGRFLPRAITISASLAPALMIAP